MICCVMLTDIRCDGLIRREGNYWEYRCSGKSDECMIYEYTKNYLENLELQVGGYMKTRKCYYSKDVFLYNCIVYICYFFSLLLCSSSHRLS